MSSLRIVSSEHEKKKKEVLKTQKIYFIKIFKIVAELKKAFITQTDAKIVHKVVSKFKYNTNYKVFGFLLN